jgi:hypothetical protein
MLERRVKALSKTIHAEATQNFLRVEEKSEITHSHRSTAQREHCYPPAAGAVP